jgi:hypothetical protein
MSASANLHRAHELAWLAAGLRRAAAGLDVNLPVSYSETVAADGVRFCEQLGVTRIGDGVAIHTAPEPPDQLPVLLGYADPTGQWYRDGRRHHPISTTSPSEGQLTRQMGL